MPASKSISSSSSAIYREEERIAGIKEIFVLGKAIQKLTMLLRCLQVTVQAFTPVLCVTWSSTIQEAKDKNVNECLLWE